MNFSYQWVSRWLFQSIRFLIGKIYQGINSINLIDIIKRGTFARPKQKGNSRAMKYFNKAITAQNDQQVADLIFSAQEYFLKYNVVSTAK